MVMRDSSYAVGSNGCVLHFKEAAKENLQLFKNRLRDVNRVIKFLGQLNNAEINYIEEYITKYSLTEFPTLDTLIANGAQTIMNDFNFILSHKDKKILRNITHMYTSTDLRDQEDSIESYLDVSEASENATPIRTLLYTGIYQPSNLQTFFKKMDEYYVQTHQNEVQAIVAISNKAEDANEEIDVKALVQPLKDNCNNFKRDLFKRILMFAGVDSKKLATSKFEPRFLDNKTVGIRLV
jgi:predicted P-loop ATPase